ncbi:hypothetical protein [Nonomuraea jabiensis]|uniref:hypothetical protein n=1 Tax=Nonomuraea jabiensis TaxID=882448 RepID=UPI003D74EEEE
MAAAGAALLLLAVCLLTGYAAATVLLVALLGFFGPADLTLGSSLGTTGPAVVGTAIAALTLIPTTALARRRRATTAAVKAH